MSRQFSLAGLLRLRQLQQDQAANGLARASSRSRSIRAREAAARRQLDEPTDDVDSSAGLRAVAAARASSQSMLADLQALRDIAESEAAEARALFTEARTRSVGLEKLEERHFAERLAAELSTEQGALDEIAVIAWHRESGQVQR